MKALDRIDAIDIAKGLGMFLIIWGHIMRQGITNHWCYIFHIPLFFFLSGLVFSPERYGGFKVFVGRKIKTLLIPYLIYSIVTWMIWAAYSFFTHADVESYWMPLLQTFIAQGSAGFLIHNGVLWFVTCLFVVECAYWWIAKLPSIYRLVITVLCAIIGVILVKSNGPIDFKLMPWNIEVALMVVLFYALGDLIKTWCGGINEIGAAIRRNKYVFGLCSIMLAAVVYLIALKVGKVSMGHANPGKYPVLFYIGAISGTTMMGIWSVLYSALIKERRSFVRWVGQNSFCMMAIHNPIKGVVVIAVAKLFHINVDTLNASFIPAFIAFAFSVAVSAVVAYIIGRCLNRTSGHKQNDKLSGLAAQ